MLVEASAELLRFVLDHDLPLAPDAAAASAAAAAVRVGFPSALAASEARCAATSWQLPGATLAPRSGPGGIISAPATPPASLLGSSTQALLGGRSVAARVAVAHLQLAGFADAILRHWEAAATVAATAATTAADPITAALPVTHRNVGALARCVATGVLASLRGDPAARLAPGEGQGGGGGSTAVAPPFDECGLPRYADAAVAGTRDAVSMVPRLLDLFGAHAEAREAFAAAATGGGAPAFVFLPWVPQLLAMLHTPAQTAAAAAAGAARYSAGALEAATVLASVAAAYPQAVYYPLRVADTAAEDPMTEPMAARAASDFDVAVCAALDRARASVASPLLDAFVSALEDLHSPEKRFEDWVKNAGTVLASWHQQVAAAAAAAGRGAGAAAKQLPGLPSRVQVHGGRVGREEERAG